MKYLMVAYKPDSTGHCGEVYPSEQDVDVYDSREDLVFALARIMAAPRDVCEEGFDFDIYRGDFVDARTYRADDPFIVANAEAEKMIRRREEEEVRQKAAEKAIANKVAADKKEQRDLSEWRRLSAKYGAAADTPEGAQNGQ